MTRLLRSAAALLAAAAFLSTAQAADYYFSPSGSDSNLGTSTSAPFASLSKLSSLDLNPGDNVYLQGGSSFTGSINLGAQDSANTATGALAGAPIKVSTYGSGLATINAGNSSGFTATNAGNIEVSNLNLVGSGSHYDAGVGRIVYDNTGNGIEFDNSLTGNVKLQHVSISNVITQNFGKNGIWLSGATGQAGYDGVTIANVVTNGNQLAGIATLGDYNNGNRNNFSNVVISHARAFNNYGEDKQPTHGNSGNGIVLGQVSNAVIERSVAHDNGVRCASTQGGPVGIWAWDSANVVIQRNESYNNGTAGEHDGGGFDLDGGVINSVMQYNYSHGNDGAGYLLAEFSGAKPFNGNTVRYNISQNDGRKNGYGALHAFAAIDDTNVYNNTVFMAPADASQLRPDGQPPSAIKFRNWTGKNLKFFNNLLMVDKDTDSNTADPTLLQINDGAGLTFSRNAYWNDGLDGVFNDKDLKALYLSTTNQPDLFGPAGEGPTLDDADQLVSMLEYTLNDNSPLIDQGLNLSSLYGIDMGGSDFYGYAPVGGAPDVGAAENLSGAAPLPEPGAIAALTIASAAMLRRRRRR